MMEVKTRGTVAQAELSRVSDLTIRPGIPGLPCSRPPATSGVLPGRSESYLGSVENPRQYTVFALLAANLSNGTGTETEAREYLQKLAPQIQDERLALVLLGTFREGNSWVARRYEIDHQGVRDTTEGLEGYHFSHTQPVRGKEVSVLHPETLKKTMLAAMRDHPARHYVLHANSHGSNLKGLGGCANDSYAADDCEASLKHHANRDKLDLPAFQRVLQEVRQQGGQRFSLIDLDACLLGYAEVMAALRYEADFIVASPSPELGVARNGSLQVGTARLDEDRSGHQQVEVFQKILSRPQVTPEELARDFVAVNASEGVIREGHKIYHAAPTLSAFSTQKLENLDRSLDALGTRLLRELEPPQPQKGLFSWLQRKQPTGLEKIQAAVDRTRVFPSGKGDPYLDLQHFMGNLAQQYPQDEEIQKLTRQVFEGVNEATLTTFHGLHWDEDKGQKIDYFSWGALGAFVPGGKNDLFTQGLRSHYQETMGRIERGGGPASRFWQKGLQRSQQMSLSESEVERLRSLAQGPGQAPDETTQGLAHKLWEREVSDQMGGLAEYRATPHLPPIWQKFVLTLVEKVVSAPRASS